jgi:hypothetical protein
MQAKIPEARKKLFHMADSHQQTGVLRGYGYASMLSAEQGSQVQQQSRRGRLHGLFRWDGYLSVEKAIHGLFPPGRHPKKPRFLGVTNCRILRRQAFSTACYGMARTELPNRQACR